MEHDKLDPDLTVLVLVDAQERLANAMPAELGQAAIKNMERLAAAAKIFHLPVIVTEQYPQGLGQTLPVLLDALSPLDRYVQVLEKIEFDACSNPFVSRVITEMCELVGEEAEWRAEPTLVVAGFETHICVYQTARSLMLKGHTVHVPLDATCARSPHQLDIAKGLLTRMGAVVTSTEAVLFDLLGKAGTSEFHAISKLVR